VSTLCARRAIVARSSRSPISVQNWRFSTNRDKLNRQIQEVERLVTRRKQRVALSSNRQKIQFCTPTNSGATEAPTANLTAFLTGARTVRLATVDARSKESNEPAGTPAIRRAKPALGKAGTHPASFKCASSEFRCRAEGSPPVVEAGRQNPHPSKIEECGTRKRYPRKMSVHFSGVEGLATRPRYGTATRRELAGESPSITSLRNIRTTGERNRDKAQQ
jgi:hypothetical protein